MSLKPINQNLELPQVNSVIKGTVISEKEVGYEIRLDSGALAFVGLSEIGKKHPKINSYRDFLVLRTDPVWGYIDLSLRRLN